MSNHLPEYLRARYDGITANGTGYFNFDIDRIECDYCSAGVVERVGVEWSPETGNVYEPVNGSEHVERFQWICVTCAAVERAFEAEFGCSIAPLGPPREQRDWRYSFELERAA